MIYLKVKYDFSDELLSSCVAMKKSLKYILYAVILLGFIIFYFRNGSLVQQEVSHYGTKKDELSILQGKIVLDTSGATLSTYEVLEGEKYVLVYEREGTTFAGINDYEAKYKEILIFEFDTILKNSGFCNLELAEINCNYYCIIYSKTIEKYYEKIRTGCIRIDVTDDIVNLSISIEPNYKFKSLIKESSASIRISREINLPDELGVP